MTSEPPFLETEGPDTPASPWKEPMRAGNVSIKIGLMRSLMLAIVQAYESRYGVERCCEGAFPEGEEAMFVTANAMTTTLSVSGSWLESNYLPDQETPVDPMVAWVLESARSLFADFRELPWVTTRFEKGELQMGIKRLDETEPEAAPAVAPN
jgi:hypothetical protein